MLARCFALYLFLLLGATLAHAQGGIALVQHTSKDAGTTTSSLLPFNSNNTAGNWIAVVIRAGKSGQVFTVTDSKANTYQRAVQFNQTVDSDTLGIFYAENIAGGANTITVSDTISGTLRFAILEYSGVALANSLDAVAVASQGTSASPNSGNLTTTANRDLLLGAILTGNPASFTAGSGYTIEETVPAEPNTKLIAEDQIQITAGTATASALLGASDNWGAALAAFKAAGSPPPPPDTTPPTAPSNLTVTSPTPSVQAVQGYINSTFLTAHTTAPFDSSGGDAIVVTASSHAGVTMTPSDSFNNTWISAAGPMSTNIGFDLRTQVWYAKSPTVGPNHTFTLNLSAAESLVISVIVVKSSSLSAPIDAISTIGDDGGSQALNVASPNITTTSSNDLLIGFAKSSVSETWTSGSGYTPQAAASSNFLDAETGLGVVTPGTYNATFSISTAATWQAVIVAVKPSASALNLSWTASTDPDSPVSNYFVERCQGAGCANFAQIAAPAGTTYTDTGLAASTSYSYRARATDPAGNLSGYSNVVTITTGSGGAPSIMATGGTPQSATINTAFAVQLQATVKDAGNNPVSGVNVTFTAPGSGASGVFSNSTATIIVATNASGVASAPFTANSTAGGPYTVTASAVGVATSASFSLTNLPPAQGGIALAQHASKDAGTATSSSLAFVSANTAENWIAVVIRAGKSGQVFTVTDSRGNTYRKAIQFNETIDSTTLGIFYAENIAGGANTITVSDTISGTLRFAILEYSGVAMANSLDGAAVAAQGTSASPNSGIVTTTASGDLVLAGISTANPANFTSGSGYLPRDFVPAEPNTKLLVEDQIQPVAGNISANASLGASDNWGAAAAAFKSAATATPPTFTPPSNLAATPAGPVQVNLSWTAAVETGGTITSYLVERCVGAACSNFAQIGSSSATTNYSDTSASLTGSTPYSYRVRATDGTNFSGYSNTASATTAPPTFTAPSNLSVTPAGSTQLSLSWTAATETGGTITSYLVERCTGLNCANTPSNFAQVGSSATTSFGDSGLTIGATYSYRVRATGTASNFSPYSNVATATPVLGPSLSTLSLTQGPIGASITIAGSGFGATQGSSTITFNGTPTTPATSWSDTSIDTSVPAGATTGNVVVTVGGSPSNGLPFTVTPPPNISGLNPNAGPIGTVVNVNGTNFGPTVGTRASLLLFNGVAARTTSWSDTLIVAPVPTAAISGNVVVSVGGISSNGVPYTVTPGPNVASLSPTSGVIGTSVTISGAGFGATQGSSTITFNGVAAAPTPANWSDTSIVAPVPTGATTGNVVVTVGGIASNGVSFSVAPAIGGIALVQHTSKDAGTTTSSSLAFNLSNTAGNWIAVLIRAGKQGQVFTVTDTQRNSYRQAVQFNQTADSDTLGIFYAENITGGVNTVTVSDTISGTLRFALVEYSGVAQANSLDGTAAAQGSSASPNSGSLTTTVGGDLLLGAILTGNAASFTAGSGYRIEEAVPAEPNSKLIAEDQIQGTAGTISASASLGVSDNWGAALAAFRSASGAALPLSVSISPSAATVATGYGTQSFTTSLVSDFQHQGVTWSLSGSGCSGAACGSLTNITSTSVTYNGPATTIPNPASVTLTATAVADNTKTASATISVIQGVLSVAVSPKRAAVTMSALQTVQFTAAVSNDPSNSGVTWLVDGNTGGTSTTGTVSTAGLYTPGTQPGAHTITAASLANASVSASSTVAVTDLAGVPTYHNDAQRTGQNLKEYALTPANVNSSTFAQLFACPVDGDVYAQPLYIANLTVGGANRNVVFIATEHDSVYAFDADSPSCIQLWKTSFLMTGVTTMPWQDTGTNDIFPEIGITSTPVMDPVTTTIYVQAKTKETVGTGCSTGSPCYVNRLHALDITSGTEKLGGPVVISAPNFDPLLHFNRPALLLNNGTVYVGFGSHGDRCNWQGWLFGYNATSLAQTFVWSTSNPTTGCNGAAIWQGGDGPAADAGSNIYVITGNGTYDGTKNFSESVLKLSSSGSLLDWFTPFNHATLDANDIDMGSAGPLILPDSVGSVAHPHLALATGKIAILFLLDQANMGKFHSSTNNDVQEVIPVPPPNTTQLDGGNYGVPAYWNGNIYTTGQNYPLSQFHIANGTISTPQFAQSTNTFPPRGATPSVSASGGTNGIVWILDLAAWPSNGNAILDAYDATNVSNLLYSSPSSGSGVAGAAVKFTVPTVANGKVYVGGQSSFTVFGLLPN